MHALEDTHDTPYKTVNFPCGRGADSMLHDRPFQRSASVTPSPEAITYVPTAVHTDAPEHDTENS
jgi:hypothetical protein